MIKAELCEKLQDLDKERAKVELGNLKTIVRETLKDVRKIIYDLRPMSLDDLGLKPTLERYIYNYMKENYEKEIKLKDISDLIGMTEVAFSRFLKKRTGRNFIDSLNDIRLGHAARLLIDTTYSISEICTNCGFNNLSNFNRIFKKKKGCTPREFRENYKESKYFL